MSSIDDAVRANNKDDIFSYDVPSRTDPHSTYHVELDSYNGNGECACDDFTFNHRPLLCRRISPREALTKGLIQRRKYQQDDDQALMCYHLVRAHLQFERDLLNAFIAFKKKRSHQAQDSSDPEDAPAARRIHQTQQ